jgi:hypothetical protein
MPTISTRGSRRASESIMGREAGGCDAS